MLEDFLQVFIILLLLGADHGCNGSCARVAGSWPVAWVGFDNDHLGPLPLMTGPDLVIELAAITLMKAGNAVRRIAAIAWVAQPGASARWRVRGQYVGKTLEAGGC